MKVEKDSDFERGGKHFCSEEHAQQYTEQAQASGTSQSNMAHHEGNHYGGC